MTLKLGVGTFLTTILMVMETAYICVKESNQINIIMKNTD